MGLLELLGQLVQHEGAPRVRTAVLMGWPVARLTKRQTEVLDAVTRIGAIALHLQTGRMQTVIRNLIKKGLLTVGPDGRVGRPRN